MFRSATGGTGSRHCVALPHHRRVPRRAGAQGQLADYLEELQDLALAGDQTASRSSATSITAASASTGTRRSPGPGQMGKRSLPLPGNEEVRCGVARDRRGALPDAPDATDRREGERVLASLVKRRRDPAGGRQQANADRARRRRSRKSAEQTSSATSTATTIGSWRCSGHSAIGDDARMAASEPNRDFRGRSDGPRTAAGRDAEARARMTDTGAAIAIMGDTSSTPSPGRRAIRSIQRSIAATSPPREPATTSRVPGRGRGQTAPRRDHRMVQALPLWLDLGDIHVVHACWNDDYMDALRPHPGPGATSPTS